MKTPLHLTIFTIACIIGLSVCFSDGLIALDQHNFADALSQSRFVVVEFFNSQCKACQRSTHEFAKAAHKLSSTYPHVKFFILDGNAESMLAAHYNVQVFPAIKLFVRGSRTSIDFPADPIHKASSEDIVEWILSYAQHPSLSVSTQKEVESFINDNEVVGLFLGKTDSQGYKEYLDMADQFEDVVFIHSNDENLRRAEGLKEGEEAFVLYKKFDEGHNRYQGPLNSKDLQEFVKLQKYPTAVQFGEEALQKIFYEGEDAIFLIKRKGDKDAKVEEAFRKAALALKGEVAMTIIDYEDEVGIPVDEIISVPLNRLLVTKEEDLPAIRLLTPRNKMRRYGFQKNVTKEDLKTFYENAKAGKVKPIYVSAPIEKDPYDGDVRKVVSKEFRKVVVESDKNVLVLFCSQHYYVCREFELIYNELATELKHSGNDLLFAKVDTATNEIEGVSTRGGLGIRLYIKGNKNEPIEYTGAQDKTSLKEFIEDLTMRSKSKGQEDVFKVEK